MIPRFVPPRRVLRIAAWVAFWPVAFTALHGSLAATIPIVGAFVPLVVRHRRAALFGACAVGCASALVEKSWLPRLGGLAIGAAALVLYEWLMRLAHEREEDTIDTPVRLLVPFSLWIGAAAVLTAHGAQAAHLHATLPRIAQVLAAVAFASAVASVLSFQAIRESVARAYRGDDPQWRVRKIDDGVDTQRLSDVTPSDAAIVEGAALASAGPYRAGEGRPIARVPLDRTALERRHRRWLIGAIAATMFCAGAGVLAMPSYAKIAHRADLGSSPATLPPLPAKCEGGRVKLRFVALAPLRVLDIEEIAARYRETGIADVLVERPLYPHELWFDRGRHQIAGEDILEEARERYGVRPNELVVVVTDRDMFLREVDWRFAFATRGPGIGVVSIARMDPNFPLLMPATYDPAPSECGALVRARAFRMITRHIMFAACSAESVEDPRSVRRRSVMGLSDLDAIDEATY